MPELGAIPSVTGEPDVTRLPEARSTALTSDPARTAIQLTGAPSATPNDPDPRTASPPGESGPLVDSGAAPIATAVSVESSMSN
jgi:hypothetical protein